MSEDADDEDKTEDPTDRKLQKAYENGDVPRSTEMAPVFVLMGALFLLVLGRDPLGRHMGVSLGSVFENAHTVSFGPGGMAFMMDFLRSTAWLWFLPLVVLFVFALVGAVVQTKVVISAHSMMPSLSKISPMSGFKRLFGMDALMMFLKGLVKVTIVAVAAFVVLWPERLVIGRTLNMGLGASLSHIATLAVHVLGAVLAAYAVVAGFDFIYQRMRWYRRQRMTLRELRDEMKESEGNPEIKAKIRAIRMARAKKRMMANVPQATVVVTNPTHFAVALKYEQGMHAPICVAKGLDRVALKIRELAKENRVPVVENPPLARVLYKDVEIDEEIPAEHYKAVAEVIGYVMRIVQRRAS